MSARRKIQRIGIVNRGEAAMRCIRAIKALRAIEGSELRSVALYTAADRDAPFVRHADGAIELPVAKGDVASFLDHDLLLEALKRGGADAVWPGWGFVAEDPTFVERCTAEGLIFLGPSADAMRRLGDKISAKQIAEAAGVPVTPWSESAVADESSAASWAEKLGYPVAIKASAGGGGRGIRMVDRAEDLAAAFRSARSEAASAFGDDRLFLECKVSGGRHIEVQIIADQHGHIAAVGMRDCSVQRRHQKLLEEAPPPGLDRELGREIKRAAERVAREVRYSGAGTVEFLVSPDRFAFLEMNPRLQVEHGITEEITGLDLVQLQIRVARGESLSELEVEESGCAIEARVCAEDPDAGFLPSPGRIARFEPALGPRVRVDSGVTAGSTVPPAFDSLVAKVIATGADRAEAIARLACALSDFELVIEGGASNKGFLIELLGTEDYRRGGVDTGWLDRHVAERDVSRRRHAPLALISAAILAYQETRRAARLNFFADTTVALTRVPPSRGQRIDLTHGSEQYELEVFAVGGWRYRVHLDGRVSEAALREEGANAARLDIDGRSYRVSHDASETGLRVEVEGHPHRFGRQTMGQVRAGTPAMVVAIHVQPGDRVAAGQTLGVLEAMKMEIGFDAPVAGLVKEVRALKGQQIKAGEVLLVIEPENANGNGTALSARVVLPEQRDPLAPLFTVGGDAGLGAPDLASADALPASERQGALLAVRQEVQRVLLGYDAHPERAERLARFLDQPLPEPISDAFRRELAEVSRELTLFADVEQLFIRAPGASVGGELGPSNNSQLRTYVRRIRAGGTGLPEQFLALVRNALSHYGWQSTEPDAALERAVLRLFASQQSQALRGRLVLALLVRVTRLAESGFSFAGDAELENALLRIAGMRGLVSNAVADAAADASYLLFERPRIETLAERTSRMLEQWIRAAVIEPSQPPDDVLDHLAEAPRGVFDRVGSWLEDEHPGRRAIALAAHLHRLYSQVPVERRNPALGQDGAVHPYERVLLRDGRCVLATQRATAQLDPEGAWLETLLAEASTERELPGAGVVEVFVPVRGPDEVEKLLPALKSSAARSRANLRLTLNFVTPSGSANDLHESFLPGDSGLVLDTHFQSVHPETALRIDLPRLDGFELERLPGAEGIYCFYGRSREVESDERVFVLADVRGRSPDGDRDVTLHLPAFEHAFYEACRCLRANLSQRDPKRRLQWNRIVLFVGPELLMDPPVIQLLARKLAPATRHLGLEKVVVRIKLLDRDEPDRPAEPLEVILSDITGSNLQIHTRAPHSSPLEPRSDYERKVVEARRRRLVYPYEIVRLLTGGGRGPNEEALGRRVELPVGRFEEYDLDPAEREHPVAISVAGRPYGQNRAGVVFGIIDTPTPKVPEGLRRVLLLSDPTRGMGSLAEPECDRVCAALDLAFRLSIPVEWVPVSSGARIAMDSGTENLDATARVVRRIVQFTQAGGTIHLIIQGVNVGAQSYWDALAAMLMHTRGAIIMTPRASMVLTGRAALDASGSVSAEDEEAIGGFERIMGPNGEAQYFAENLADAYRVLYEHYSFSYVVPGETGPRRFATGDPREREVSGVPCRDVESGFETVGEIFDDASNPGRKRPFSMRDVMAAVIDADGGQLERWRAWQGAETAIVWDAHIGGHAVCLIGIESRNLPRAGYRSLDGPASWTGGTLFPLSSKKTARAINAASGNRPVVVLANLSGFDGSPESMRKLQLEYGAEIARAVVNFEGPIVFLVVSRYHGGAYVVFSQALNPGLRASALVGSYASVIGGGPAATVVFARDVQGQTAADPRVLEVEKRVRTSGSATPEMREQLDRIRAEVSLEKQAEIAERFDSIHTVERALEVGSLSKIVEPEKMRAFLIEELERER